MRGGCCRSDKSASERAAGLALYVSMLPNGAELHPRHSRARWRTVFVVWVEIDVEIYRRKLKIAFSFRVCQGWFVGCAPVAVVVEAHVRTGLLGFPVHEGTRSPLPL